MNPSLSEYLEYDASAMAAAVRSGEVGSGEWLALALQQTERVNPALNAVTTLMKSEAESRLNAHLAGPLAGVPMLIKDVTQDYAGLPTSYGSRAFQRIVPRRHSAVVARLLAAGALIFGKTNTPELGLKAVTDSRALGVARNPWNTEHVPGGSSGGSAAAVAAGIAPMAGANDGGGSIRIPAACCGLFGLKPSRGRVSVGPASGEVWEGASSDLVVSRSVRDSALALDVLAGPEPGDPFVIVPPGQSYVELAQRQTPRLRIGFTTRSPIGMPVHPEAVRAVEGAVKLLAGLGHEVDEAEPDYDGAALARCYLHLYFGQVAAAIAEARRAGARKDDFELLTRVLGALGGAMSAGRYVDSRLRWNDFARSLGAFHAQYDLLLTPTLAHPPIRHGQDDPPAWQRGVLSLLLGSGLLSVLARLGLMDGLVDQIARDNLARVPFTQLANLTGTPAMSVPLHWTAEGLPMGVQFIGRFGAEALLLQLATQLERAQPWFGRLPPLALGG